MLERFMPLLVGIILLGLGACQPAANAQEETAAATTTGSEAKEEATSPDYPFELATSFDQIASIFERQSDSTYVINFWATWCKPCVEELPYFEQLHDDFGDEKLKVILVSLDFAKDIDKKLVPFLEEHKLRSEVIALLDGQYHTWIDKVDANWSGAIPVTVLYNAKERKFVEEQFSGYEELSGLVSELLRT